MTGAWCLFVSSSGGVGGGCPGEAVILGGGGVGSGLGGDIGELLLTGGTGSVLDSILGSTLSFCGDPGVRRG